ncbi:hypothetical protein F5Y17DRAFT_451206 [Xylariaceae sp. FL0594]|nr:hypothetical protein F5Y17DRAFT_451206 [Xylariaceae sp. FL0594]
MLAKGPGFNSPFVQKSFLFCLLFPVLQPLLFLLFLSVSLSFLLCALPMIVYLLFMCWYLKGLNSTYLDT